MTVNTGRKAVAMGHQSWAKLLADFDTYQRAAGKAEGTRRNYRYRLLDLSASHRFPASITTDHLLAVLATPDWKPDTRKNVRTAYRAFFGWAHRSGRLPADPSTDLPTITVPAGEARPVPEHVVRADTREASPREAFMMRLARYAGMRCCEIAILHASWWDGRHLYVIGKGGKQRKVPITHPQLVAELDALVEAGGYAFPNRWTGAPLTRQHVSRLLSAALRDTYTGHQLRHSFGTVTMDGTGDLQAVADVMGHASVNTTMRYSRTSSDRLLAVARAAAA